MLLTPNFQPLPSRVRIISYNILDGGVGRADPIAEVLLAQRPDVVGLVEADDPAILDRIAWRLGFDCIAAEGRKGRTAALLTRGRILESINHTARVEATLAAARRAAGSASGFPSRPPRSFLEATIELEGTSMSCALVHATAKASERRERRREEEIATVLEVFADRRAAGTAHILFGDFNATSPIQQIERDRLPDAGRKFFDKYGDLPRRAVQEILTAGYIDTFAACDPEAARCAATFTTLQPGQRVDYIFAFGFAREQIKSAWIETDRLATYASDHYPIGAEVSHG